MKLILLCNSSMRRQ